MEIRFGKSQPGEKHLGLIFGIVAISCLEPVLEFAQFTQKFGSVTFWLLCQLCLEELNPMG